MEIILEERRIKTEKKLILITKSSGFSDHENVFFYLQSLSEDVKQRAKERESLRIC